MTYIGQQPATTFDSGIQDRFTGLSTNTVTLNHEISAEEDILVVWNNIVQDKNTYSVGGTGNKTLTLGGTLVSADVVTVYYLNKVMQSVNPTAGSVNTTQLADLGISTAKLQANAVTGAKLNTDVISAQTALGATPADTDELLVSDAGVLKRVDYSYLKGGANTPAFLAYLNGSNQSLSHDTHTKIQFNTEVYDTASAYDHSSNYQFTVPSGQGGKYFFYSAIRFNDSSANLSLKFVVGGSNKSVASMKGVSGEATTLNHTFSQSLSAGDTVEIQGRFQSSGTLNVLGHGSEFDTHFGGFKLAE